MTDFLLELRCEEIPARMQAGARAELEKLFRKELDAAGVAAGETTVWSTPRRLALIARDLPEATEAVREETKGPRTGAPEQALEGFLRKTGLGKDQLEDRDGVFYAVVEKPGRATREVLAEAIPAIVRAFAWPKSMRWGAASLSTESVRWVRPLSGIVAILGEELVECEVGGVPSGYATMGHRFHNDRPITIGGAHDYQEKLCACHVIVDHAEREGIVREMSRAAALAEGLTLIEDEGLVVENAGLTEWPVPLLGRFEAAFLDVPPEVIQLTARTNQKYFVCNDNAGKLANAFVCTANIDAADGGAAIVDGNRKVLAARLSDARFFWEQDRKTSLADHAKKLERITFHEKLGTVADKVERVAKLARWLVEEGVVKGADADQAEQAARLAKADLVTEMVGEFPELQGLMGGYYARAEGLPDAVADAIRDHYKPVGQGDEVPIAPVTVAVSLADKLDTLVGFFAVGEEPTGSKDPFALRRAALAVIALTEANQLRFNLALAIGMAHSLLAREVVAKLHAQHDVAFYPDEQGIYTVPEPNEFDLWLKSLAVLNARPFEGLPIYEDRWGWDAGYDLEPYIRYVVQGFPQTSEALLSYVGIRLEEAARRDAIRVDLIRAASPLATPHSPRFEGLRLSWLRDWDLTAPSDLVGIRRLAEALQAFMSTEDGANLLAGYKRAANILKKEDWKPAAARIPRTGEEDPLAMVDDPDLAAVVRARVEMQKQLSYTPEPAESALIEALDSAEPTATRAVEAEDFASAMGALASLRAPIDAFFDNVTVNDADPAKRAARLDLLARFRDAVHRVADFSRIEG